MKFNKGIARELMIHYNIRNIFIVVVRVFNLENNAVIFRDFEARNFAVFSEITENNGLSTQTKYVRFRYLFVVVTRYFGK